MHVDSRSFFMLMATFGVGGAIGYVASQKHVLAGILPDHGSPPAAPAPPAPSSGPSAAPPVADAAPLAAVCDDGLGVPDDCPGPGLPTEEGGCGNLPMKRCNEFKQAMKPKVAQAAVECIKTLKGPASCDAFRINLCGHLALMAACPEREDATHAATAANVTAVCDSILGDCKSARLADCRQTLSGMNEAGRLRMLGCMKKHCSDKGLLGCEALADAK